MSEKASNIPRLRAAKIVSVHGVRGQVKVQVFLEDAHDLTQLGPLTNHDGSKVYDLKIKGQAKGTLICSVKGVQYRDQAEALRGTELFVERAALPQLEDEEEFYIADLAGLEVHDQAGARIGSVKAVQDHGAGDIVVVTYDQPGRRDELFAFTYDSFPQVDLGQGYLTLIPPAVTSERDAETDEE